MTVKAVAGAETRADGALPILTSVVLLASLFLGGGTRPGFAGDAVLQVLSTLVLLYWIWRFLAAGVPRNTLIPLIFCCAVAMVPLAQLIPLPPVLWHRLPGRELAAQSLELVGAAQTWRPLSLTPEATWLWLAAVLPAAALLIGVVQLGRRERRWLMLLTISFGVASAVIGLVQVAQGRDSPLRIYQITNPTEAVGLFANRNHFAALLYSLLVPMAVWIADGVLKSSGRHRSRWLRSSAVLPLAGALTVLVAVVAAQAMARSRAGLGLTMAALIAGVLVAYLDPRSVGATAARRLIAGSVLFAVVFPIQLALYRILDRFGSDPLADARLHFAARTFEAAKAMMPFGSGMGSFVPVYAAFERPGDALANTFANRAHNDLFELALEAGVPGLILVAAFGVWLSIRTVQVWRSPALPGAELDRGLERAAAVIAWLLLAHSLVDYPLRTSAIMAVMALACGFLFSSAEHETAENEASAVRVGGAVEAFPAQSRAIHANNPQSWHAGSVQQAATQIVEWPPAAASTRQSTPSRGGAQLMSSPSGEIEWPAEWLAKSDRAEGRSGQQTDDTNAPEKRKTPPEATES